MVRDLLGHLEHAQVTRLVRNVKRPGFIWLLATQYPEVDQNTDVKMGEWRRQKSDAASLSMSGTRSRNAGARTVNGLPDEGRPFRDEYTRPGLREET
jgi:hypothetical protein